METRVCGGRADRGAGGGVTATVHVDPGACLAVYVGGYGAGHGGFGYAQGGDHGCVTDGGDAPDGGGAGGVRRLCAGNGGRARPECRSRDRVRRRRRGWRPGARAGPAGAAAITASAWQAAAGEARRTPAARRALARRRQLPLVAIATTTLRVGKPTRRVHDLRVVAG